MATVATEPFGLVVNAFQTAFSGPVGRPFSSAPFKPSFATFIPRPVKNEIAVVFRSIFFRKVIRVAMTIGITKIIAMITAFFSGFLRQSCIDIRYCE
jgi:hypothetical protein